MDLTVAQKFQSYPKDIAPLLHNIRDAIFDVAKQESVGELQETLKWGEPSYVSKVGSTIRFDYKAKAPEQYCLYFNCNTRLVATYREIYGDIFSFEGNRAIVLNKNDEVPWVQLKHCIALALRYHKIKHLSLLGATPQS